MIIGKNIIDDFFDGVKIPKRIGKGDFSMNDLKLHFTNIKRKRLISRYGKTSVNFKYYINIDGKEVKYLTEEEFKAGKPGYVLGNFIM